jgi:hypothetical protein
MIIDERITAPPSAAGMAEKTPRRPKKRGRISSRGIYNSICRDKLNMVPWMGFPMA